MNKLDVLEYINRVYARGLTTTSGGNLSIMDENGDIWITPSGKDKGTLVAEDIVQVKPDGERIGAYNPSIELPFHSQIYKLRPDVKAVLHVHSPYLVTYSLFNDAPESNMLPTTYSLCGRVGKSLYDIPGSIELGNQICKYISQGYDSVMMENHGVVLVAPTMSEAYKRLEALENCAKIGVKSKSLGKIKTLSEQEMAVYDLPSLPVATQDKAFENEGLISESIRAFVKRCYAHEFFEVANGAISHRLKGNDFIITPKDYDRGSDDYSLVKVVDGHIIGGEADSLCALHAAIYAAHPYVESIFIATPPYAMAYAVTGSTLDSRTIPESYINMRDVIHLGYGKDVTDMDNAISNFSPATPVMLVSNAHLITTGETITKAFDRLEVSEITAKTLITGLSIGQCNKISDREIDKIDNAFNLPKKD